MSDVQFRTLAKIISMIGGFASALFGILALLNSVFYKKFLTKLGKIIQRTNQPGLTVDDIKQRIKERLSYIGIYTIYD